MIDGLVYIFDVEQIKVLREKYNVSGILTGILPKFPQQNIFGGLPLQLSPEETKYLLETGDFHTADPTSVVKMPDEKQYPVFEFLMKKSYFIMPGLRFGCHYMAYPGDIMRYHSHYNVLGYDWDEEFELLTLVNGGRLATAVKKCWLIGAKNPETKETRVFSVEWAGFG